MHTAKAADLEINKASPLYNWTWDFWQKFSLQVGKNVFTTTVAQFKVSKFVLLAKALLEKSKLNISDGITKTKFDLSSKVHVLCVQVVGFVHLILASGIL